MTEKKVFSVADLAEKIGVPRTTITDWLNRFAPYIESEMRGKRRVFTEATLAVLSQIASLRDYGLSTYDIEKELAKQHPVQAELHEPETEPKPEPEVPQEEGTTENALVAPSAIKQAEELGKLLNKEIFSMAQALEDSRKEAQKLAARSLRWQLLGLLLLVIMGAAMVMVTFRIIEQMTHQGKQHANVLQESTAGLVDEIKKRDTQIDQQGQKLQEMVVVLDKNRQDYQDNLEKLRKELAGQQEKFEEELKKMSKDSAAGYQSEMSKLRDDFAARQLEFLKRQEDIAALKEKAVKTEADLAAAKELLKKQEQEMLDMLQKQINAKPKSKPEEVAALKEKAAKAEAELAAARALLKKQEQEMMDILQKQINGTSNPKPEEKKTNVEKTE